MIKIDTVFNSVVDFGIFKDDLCGMNNVKISGVLKVHTAIGGSMISGLVSEATNLINNITSSLAITHTGSYLSRCSHIASNAMSSEARKSIQISYITLMGSMSVTGAEDINPDYETMRNIGGIVARATSCDISLTGIALNGY